MMSRDNSNLFVALRVSGTCTVQIHDLYIHDLCHYTRTNLVPASMLGHCGQGVGAPRTRWTIFDWTVDNKMSTFCDRLGEYMYANGTCHFANWANSSQFANGASYFANW
jgi:hypothetical protein